MPSGRWATQNEPNGIFGSSLTHNVVSQLFLFKNLYHILYSIYLFPPLSFYPIGPLCTYYVFQFSVLMEFLNVLMDGESVLMSKPLFLLPSLGLFCFRSYTSMSSFTSVHMICVVSKVYPKFNQNT